MSCTPELSGWEQIASRFLAISETQVVNVDHIRMIDFDDRYFYIYFQSQRDPTMVLHSDPISSRLLDQLRQSVRQKVRQVVEQKGPEQHGNPSVQP